MDVAQRPTIVSDRTVTRLIRGSILVLAIAIPLIAAVYVLDRYQPAGPSLLERDIEVAEAAVRADPNQLTARLGLAQVYAKSGRFEDALAQYDQILILAPDAGSALLGRASANVGLERLDAAAADFTRIVELAEGGEMAGVDPQLESAFYGLGLIALRQARPQEAVLRLAAAVEINRTDADALHLLGTALLEAGQPERAVAATRQAIELVPVGWCDPYTQLGRAYRAQKDAAGVAYAAGMVAFCEGRLGDARTALASETSGPHAADAYVGLGLIAETDGDTTAAAAAYTDALAAEPGSFAALAGLARVGAAGPTTPATPAASPPGGS